MLKSFSKLCDILSVCGFADKTINNIPTVAAKNKIDALITILADIEIMNKKLQPEDSAKVILSL